MGSVFRVAVKGRRRRPSPRRVHLVMTWVWVGLAVPTLLWWRDSVLFVALISLYANFVGHLSCYQASRAEEAAS